MSLCAFVLPDLHQLPEYRATAEEILLRELLQETSCDEDLKSNLHLIQNWDLAQNFRNHVTKSGWLSKKSGPRSHIMTEEEYKEYMRQKVEKQKADCSEPLKELQTDASENIQPSLTSECRRVSERGGGEGSAPAFATDPQASSVSYEGCESDTSSPMLEELGKKGIASKLVQHNVIDRSFTDLGYIGYGDGIDLQELDSTGNWQFN